MMPLSASNYLSVFPSALAELIGNDQDLKTANPLLLFNPPENYSNSQARPNKRGI
jgi:hypothetical protein